MTFLSYPLARALQLPGTRPHAAYRTFSPPMAMDPHSRDGQTWGEARLTARGAIQQQSQCYLAGGGSPHGGRPGVRAAVAKPGLELASLPGPPTTP